MQGLNNVLATFFDVHLIADTLPDLLRVGLPNTLILSVIGTFFSCIIGLFCSFGLMSKRLGYMAPYLSGGVVAASALFGSCRYIIEDHLPRYGIASTLVELQIEGLGIDYMQRRAGYIGAVTLEEVKAVAKKLLSAEPAVMIVGPPLAGGGKG